MQNQIEILAYTPKDKDMAKFIDYFKNGLKDETGKPKLDPKLGGLARGVVNWLHGREIKQARFFSTDPKAPVTFFAAMIRRPEDDDVPWMGRIPCFDEVIDTGGLIGGAKDFASAMPSPMSTPFGWLKSRPDLDGLFSQQQDNIAKVDFDELSFTKQDFLLALQGKPDVDLNALLSQISTKQKLNVLAV